jgi:extracellular factor (EF) 3-hydroxypalmitic acid methyl ester biosynthesis protein
MRSGYEAISGNLAMPQDARRVDSWPPPSDEAPDSGSTSQTIRRGSLPIAEYVDLDGGQGRDVFFRPDRYQRSDLGPVGAVVEVDLPGTVQRCEIHDVSQNGLAFEWPRDVPVSIGLVLDRIAVKFDEHEAYSGSARVSSVRRSEDRTIVGVSLLETLMNIEDVLHLRDVKAWTAGADSKGLGLEQPVWRVPGQEKFKALVAELRLFLEDAQVRFGELEASLPWHVVNGDQETPARDALIARIRSDFALEVVKFSNDINASLQGSSKQEREALREYSFRHLHHLLMHSPWMQRARLKPLGYPGDYEIMNAVYGNHFRGQTLFAKAVDYAFALTPAADAVRTRKDLVKSQLAALLDAHADGSPVRVLTIAAGPAQEIYELFEERESIDCPLEIVLFDQDKRALTYSYGRLRRIVNSKRFTNVKLVHRHDSIKRLLLGSSVFANYGKFDAVYAVGLFDYLQAHTWVSLCRTLYDTVAPGGTLYVGNMVPTNPSRWFMELHLDWSLVYRTHDEMLELGRAAAHGAQACILEEANGVNPFVALTRE